MKNEVLHKCTPCDLVFFLFLFLSSHGSGNAQENEVLHSALPEGGGQGVWCIGVWHMGVWYVSLSSLSLSVGRSLIFSHTHANSLTLTHNIHKNKNTGLLQRTSVVFSLPPSIYPTLSLTQANAPTVFLQRTTDVCTHTHTHTHTYTHTNIVYYVCVSVCVRVCPCVSVSVSVSVSVCQCPCVCVCV